MPEPHPPVSPTPRPSPAPAGAKNVLFVIADDMRPQLGCYGHDYMHTPEIDKLSASGTLFNRAYVQYSFCAPSRNR
jgi:arylsulfatase A-like enzyme